MQSLLAPSLAQTVCALQQQLRQMEAATRAAREPPAPWGCAQLDALLPEGGLPRGALMEWFPASQHERGGGAGTLAMTAARVLLAAGGALVVVDRRQTFYPPAAAALGIDLERLILVRPKTAQDEVWAIDQALRCAGVAAVWAQLEKLGGHDFRRLQLAAESGGAVGLFVRPAWLRGQPSWAHLQIAVTPIASGGRKSPEYAASSSGAAKGLPSVANGKASFSTLRFSASEARRLRVEILRVRGSAPAMAKSIEIEIDDDGRLRAVPALRKVTPRKVTVPVYEERQFG
jgi:hypothetical protein